MIVDSQNCFLTQRNMAALATISVEENPDGLTINIGAGEKFDVNRPKGDNRANVMVWDDVVFAAIADEEANEYLSRALGKSLKFAYMDERSARLAEERFAGPDRPVSFADAFPVLIATHGSLDALNDHITKSGSSAVTMDRFRPNITIEGSSAWDEDTWSVVRCGEIIFDAALPCTRCVVTTRDQKTGEGADDNQPIRALTQIRRSNNKVVPGVLFGVNLVPRGSGVIALGDDFEILERRKTPWHVADPSFGIG